MNDAGNAPPRVRQAILLALTFGRIPLILLFLVIHLGASAPLRPGAFSLGLALLIVAAITDALDGHFARKWNLVSHLGAYADPLTDKVFYLVAFPTLVYLAAAQGQVFHARLLLAVTIGFLLRDQWVSFLRSIGALHGADARANWSGKARTLIAFPAVCCIYYFLEAPPHWPLRIPAALIYLVESAALAINLISIVVYSADYGPSLRREFRSQPSRAGREG
jgi:CDP-diacylglycerol--glycerol-3-phosphate 3-phosphatidyltransferase